MPQCYQIWNGNPKFLTEDRNQNKLDYNEFKRIFLHPSSPFQLISEDSLGNGQQLLTVTSADTGDSPIHFVYQSLRSGDKDNDDRKRFQLTHINVMAGEPYYLIGGYKTGDRPDDPAILVCVLSGFELINATANNSSWWIDGDIIRHIYQNGVKQWEHDRKFTAIGCCHTTNLHCLEQTVIARTLCRIKSTPLSNIRQQNSKQEDEYQPYLDALRTKPFMLLAGISGTGKSRIVRELAFKSCPVYLQDKDGTTPGNYCMIEVKPNWHDSSELLGYYSNIAKGYQFTKFVRFLVKAMMFPDVPFFVCMDEMNLAPVEQYFAEFLSVLETRKKAGDTIQSGILVESKYFSSYGLTGCKNNGEVYMKLHETGLDNIGTNESGSKSLIEKGLALPDNVFIIGTVNMDDTTHQFSRKVLDRAMTREMNGEDLSVMFEHTHDLKYLPAQDVWGLKQFKPRYVSANEVLDAFQASGHAEIASELQSRLVERLGIINSILKHTPFVVSYRVLNELVIYTDVLMDRIQSLEEAVDIAVDQITLMKILPRIEGDEDMLGNAKDDNNRLCRLEEVVGPESKQKLIEMNNRLETGFTRFWP